MTRVVATGAVPVSLRPAGSAPPERLLIAAAQNAGSAGRIWYAATDDPPTDPADLAAFLAALPSGPAHYLDPGQTAFNLSGNLYAWSNAPERLVITDAPI